MEDATFVIVGGGIAGVSCAEMLGHLCPSEKVIILTASSVVKAVTNVVPLTKMLAQFDVVEQNPQVLVDSQPSLKIIHDPVKSIDSSKHTVTCESGLTVKYKKLCLCSGGTPNLISSTNEFVIGIRDTESVEKLKNKISSARRIVVVGNGGIATEIVYELSGVEIVWVIKDRHISAPFIDAGAAEFFREKLSKGKGSSSEEKEKLVKRRMYSISGNSKNKGSKGAALGPDWHSNVDLRGRLRFLKGNKISVMYKCEVVDIMYAKDVDVGLKCMLGSKWPVYVKLSNGEMYGCDVIISATGVVPNSRFELEDGEAFVVAEDGGIKVDDRMCTNLEDIFAAGDVCSASWKHCEHWFQMRLWTQAHQMGCYAAKSMFASLNGEYIFQDFCFELFTHVTNFFGYKVVLLGLFNGQKLDGDYSCQLRVTPGVEYIKLVMKDGRLQGAILIGDNDIEEMCENLILNKLDVTDIENDLLNPDVDIDDYFD